MQNENTHTEHEEEIDFGIIEAVATDTEEVTEKKKKKITASEAFARAITGNYLKLPGRGQFKMFVNDDTGRGFSPVSVYEWRKNHWAWVSDSEGFTVVIDWLRKNPSFSASLDDRKVRAIWSFAKIDMLRCEPIVVGSSVNRHRKNREVIVLPTLRHYIVIRDGRACVEKPDPEYHMRFVIDIDLTLEEEKCFESVPSLQKVFYNPAPYANSYFSKFIRQMFPDDGVRSVVQEFTGAVFFKRKFQKAVWMYGNGSNGKSTFLGLLEKLIPNGYQPMNLGNLSNPHALHHLMGASIIGVPEVPKGHFDEEKLKSLISGDSMEINGKGVAMVSHSFDASVWIMNNDEPNFQDKSEGTYRRFVIIKIENFIDDMHKDKDLVSNIHEKDMLSFFNWALAGALKIAARGFDIMKDHEMPKKLLDAKAEIKLNSNSVAQFIAASGLTFCDIEKRKTPKADIIKRYNNFCLHDLGGQTPIVSQNFWKEVRRHFPGVDTLTVNARILGKIVPCTNFYFEEREEKGPIDFFEVNHEQEIFGKEFKAMVDRSSGMH